ncbi:MAG TPA: hypothetical protein VE753_01290, partial [Gaiellaceae bacterium]|nr:hypothetical protein [Gaiellaceae bacterium]
LLSVALVLLLLPRSAGARPVAAGDDTTPPSVTYTIDGIVGSNGWYRGSTGGDYVVVRWTVTDPDSPITSTSGCEPAIKIDGPNTGTTRTCTATSDGGTTGVTTKTIKIDADAPTGVTASPSRPTDANGWYNHALTISWSGSDATSGIDSCTSALGYSGPDSNSASVSGTCIDKAGNSSAPVAFGLKYDATKPAVSAASPSRQPDQNGWYNHTLIITWSGSDATSGIDSCTSLGYSGPDSGSASVSGTCTDKAGNTSAQLSFAFKYDSSAPGTAVAADRGADANGWYNHTVAVSWSGTDPTSGVASCTSPVSYSGPDSGSASVSGSCADKAGNIASATLGFKYDDTAPVVTASAGRSPDANGWYNHTVTVSWNGSDPASGVASCTSPVGYSGPDSGSASVSGSCTDKAGNSSAAVPFGFKYDDTAPAIAAAAARSPDVNGWYNHAVLISWSGTDATSGIDSCTSVSYSGPDSGSASAGGSCTDKAGNTAGSAFALKYDSTGPAVTAAADRSPDVNGWYNHPLTIGWSGTDATSGIDSCTSALDYSGPDSNSASVSGTCRDKAGNASAPAAFGFKYDATAPVVSAAPGRSPDANGWYNHPLTIGWSGADPVSGVASCTAPANYGGPDSGSATASGTCTDKAGNTAGRTFGFKYDATAPRVSDARASRSPDQDGWYNHPLTIDWSGSDATSGIASCTSLEYSGPDSAAATASGGCIDAAGNTSGQLAFPFQYDGTAPAVSATADRPADSNGWYNHAFTIAWSGVDAVSGIASCSAPVTYIGPDSANVVPSGGCTDKAGNTAGAPFPFKYDDTAPAVTPAASRQPDANGWYNHPLRIVWAGSDATSGIASCTALDYGGPDTSGAAPGGSCTDKAGNSATTAFPFKYDATAPLVSGASPSRPPDHDGWYNHGLSIGWSGSDATAGIASCTALAYDGPDDAHAQLDGTCVDHAGNVGDRVPFAFGYDGTPPRLWAVKLRPANRVVVLTWQVSGAAGVEISRSPGRVVYRGTGRRFSDRKVKNGVRYRYTLKALDAAGNSALRTVAGIPRPALYAPARDERVRAGASLLFAWLPVERATYYNLQLWRNGRIVAASWPASPPYRLHSPWRFRGRLYRLAAGRYTWYVWPGFGSRARAHYGRLLGKSTFVVVR